jgi:hypothetical protein
MASGKMGGFNYGLDNGTVRFFDAKGMQFGNGRWAINVFTDRPDTEVSPETMLPDIRTLVAGDEAAGFGDKIATVLAGPRQAVILFLEGVITAQHLAGAKEDANYVDLPEVTIDGRTLTVRVMNDPELSVATADEAGNII